ncbi:uncharacterized protein MELLADRAFT_60272 [Melampsora larici-populina 98AG31]|uniref:Uncharacterized protein n=1 Tax=Melampsora larici-populina (strain 98AG31 / pathotype 3-4-7) TaxID=747676 RepID=F4RAQ7_MELLP|nr:uncharacterized protein MELLADRAFT_60272 [Melampsora larici-populina 98AG31]EGG10523.1 hypothetical protein MELLADRAFT_60272 [Melampsora larici-populina 98AG31]
MASFSEEINASKEKIIASGTKIKITKAQKQSSGPKVATRSQKKTGEEGKENNQQLEMAEQSQTQAGTSTSITNQSAALEEPHGTNVGSGSNGNKGEEKEKGNTEEEEEEDDHETKKAKWMSRTEHEYYFGDVNRADEMLQALNAVYGGAYPTTEERDRITNSVGYNVPNGTPNVARVPPSEVARERPRTESLVAGGESESEDEVEIEEKAEEKTADTPKTKEKKRKVAEPSSGSESGKTSLTNIR